MWERSAFEREIQNLGLGVPAHLSISSPSMAGLNFEVSIADIVDEMKGVKFKLRIEQTIGADKIPKGSAVSIVDWKGKEGSTTIEFVPSVGPRKIGDVQKIALDPIPPSVAGIRYYSVGIASQQKAVKAMGDKVASKSKELANWQAQKDKYVRNRKFWEDTEKQIQKDLAEREKLLKAKEGVLSDMLVLETMYNRFDPIIKQWVDFYNGKRWDTTYSGCKPKTPLDPNIVKSMAFQESRMGTHGDHLMLPPYSWSDRDRHPIRSRFNILQAVDSWNEQQLIMIEEMDTDIFKKYKLGDLKAKHKSEGMSGQDFIDWNGGDFISAIKELYSKRNPSGKNLLGVEDKDLHLDYSFWIRTGIRWLFHKHCTLPSRGRSWSEAVRAYNGTGPRAIRYKRSVMGRVGSRKALFVGNK